MYPELKGKYALVTGAARGFGRAIFPAACAGRVPYRRLITGEANPTPGSGEGGNGIRRAGGRPPRGRRQGRKP